MKYIVTIFFTAVILLYACTKDVGILPQAAQMTDSTLFAMVTTTTTQYSYKATNGDSVFTSNSFGGHTGQYSLRINKKAFDAMTAAGKLPDNGTFPDSSLLVKKMYTSFPSQVDQYAVMYKENGAWRWAKYGAGGNVIQSFKSASESDCIGCHAANTKDRVQTFGEHP
ncbi:MAG: Cytochrome [Bacteroidetes bacterium]|jgi:hypothetical protein|nr:Cytochrome [Bacteroidota bacterium]